MFGFTGDQESLKEFVPASRDFLNQSRDEFGEFINGSTNLLWALLAALEGNREEAVKYVRRGIELAEGDVTNMSATLNYACQTLGMVGATQETVDCLRRGFTSPSIVYPFFEPHLPHYDPVRDDPEFVELVAEFR